MIVPIIMGSEKDKDFASGIGEYLEKFGIDYEYRVASAHKAPEFALEVLEEYDSKDEDVVYIAVAGRSNALCGVVDGNTENPVITCPPTSSTFAGKDIYSSLRMPSGVAPMVVIEPKNAALAAAKIFSLKDAEVGKKIAEYQTELEDGIKTSDEEVSGRIEN
ncbi:MAG: AIR carboxylase family protein [Candidatus Natronoplasma sp.]